MYDLFTVNNLMKQKPALTGIQHVFINLKNEIQCYFASILIFIRAVGISPEAELFIPT